MRRHPSLLAALVALVLVAGAAPAAGHPAVDGNLHAFGEMVQYPMVFPVQGDNHYTDTFWASRGQYVHHAQDIMADKMTPVVAVADGTVGYVNWSRDPNGLNLERCCSMTIDHDDGWSSVYIHLNNDSPGTDDGAGWGIADGIVPGTPVTAGQLIGWVGDSGNAEGTAPHLHFELKDPEGIYVNPYEALLAAEQGIVITSGGVCLTTRPRDAKHLLATTSTLRRGDRGVEVEELQEFLSTFGYPLGEVDGRFGRKTAAALEDFQADRGLVVDGIAGTATRAEIAEILELARHRGPLAPGSPTLTRGMRGWDVRRLKHLLAGAGFDPGEINGRFNVATKRAVRKFQRAHDLKIDGIVGPQTRNELAVALGLVAVITCD